MSQDIKVQGEQVIAQNGMSVTSGGHTITAGGQSITAGGQTITAGGQTITAGGQSISAGGQTVTGGLAYDQIKGSAGIGTVQTVATGGTIAIGTNRVVKVTVSAGATASNLTLGTVAGSGAGVEGQEIVVINENATSGSTLGFTSTSVSGTFSILGLQGRRFLWDSTQTLWAPI